MLIYFLNIFCMTQIMACDFKGVFRDSFVLFLHGSVFVGCLLSLITNYWISNLNGNHYGLINKCKKNNCSARSNFMKFGVEENGNVLTMSWAVVIRRGFRLPQRLHLRTLKNFVSEKSGKRCKKIGEMFDKIGKLGNFEEVHFFPVSVPGCFHDIQQQL